MNKHYINDDHDHDDELDDTLPSSGMVLATAICFCFWVLFTIILLGG